MATRVFPDPILIPLNKEPEIRSFSAGNTFHPVPPYGSFSVLPLPSVSRACATYFNPEKEVVSLCYTGNTFINNSSFRGRLKETTQMGVERMGDDSPEADAEILAMTVECLLATGLTEFQG